MCTQSKVPKPQSVPAMTRSGAHHLRPLDDATRHQLGMLDVVGRAIDTPRHQHFVVGQSQLLPLKVSHLMRVPRVGTLQEKILGLRLEDDVPNFRQVKMSL